MPTTRGERPWPALLEFFFFYGSIHSYLDKSADVIARAGSAEGACLMQEATDAARKLGIFGAPTFAVGTEIFWGVDRLEEAIAFASGC